MTPDDVKARFIHEYIKSSNLEAVRREIAAGLRGPAGPPPDFRVHMIAALEAVAADIWDEGCEHGGRNGHSDHWRQDEEDPDLAHWPYDDNPYRASETASAQKNF